VSLSTRRRMVPAGPSAPPGGMLPQLVELGRIVNRHGIRGEVRVLLHNADSSSMFGLAEVVLTRPDGTREVRRVLGARPHKQFALLTLQGTLNANDAEGLIGCTVSVRREELPPLEPATVYHVDLIGCTVRTIGGEVLGSVREVLVTGSNDVCVVDGGAREYLIPWVADVIAELDPAARRIVVRPLPGLLDA
jgi:16S rRNA processing protein RimM